LIQRKVEMPLLYSGAAPVDRTIHGVLDTSLRRGPPCDSL